MGLPGIFEVYQLAEGPSAIYTHGSIRIGKAFRDLLLSSPYGNNYRILIELRGNFSKNRQKYQTGQAVVAGLGGYAAGESASSVSTVYNSIREKGCFSIFGETWPFNPESDLLFEGRLPAGEPDSIRFHLVNRKGAPVYQAEYRLDENGRIVGPGIPEIPYDSGIIAPSDWREISQIIEEQGLSIPEYVVSGESNLYGITRNQVLKRMEAAWNVMMVCIDHGLKSGRGATYYHNYLNQVSRNPGTATEMSRCAVYAAALTEEMLGNKPVITAPTCAGAGILPAVFRVLREKYLLTDDRIVEGMLVGGLFGSIALARINSIGTSVGIMKELAASAAMAAAGTVYLTGGTSRETERAASMAALMLSGGQEPGLEDPEFIRQIVPSIAASVIPVAEMARISPDDTVPGFDEVSGRLLRRS